MASAIGIHVARIGFLPISKKTGAVVDKNNSNTKLTDALQTEHQHVMLKDSTIANTLSQPAVALYLEKEAQIGYILYHMDQNMIVTYAAADIKNAT